MHFSKIKGRPLCIAHRGASHHAPENTHRAFQLAFEMGADGLEIDIYQTKDDQLVVCHDDNIKKLTGHDIRIRKSTLKELRKIDFGDGEKIPLLHEVLEQNLNRFIVINIELKSHGVLKTGLEPNLVKCLKSFEGVQDKIVVSSFNGLHLMRLRAHFDCRVGFLACEQQMGLIRTPAFVNRVSPYSLHLDKDLKDQKRFGFYFTRPEPKWIWTVDDEKEIRSWMNRRDVEGVITNRPDLMRKVIEEKYV